MAVDQQAGGSGSPKPTSSAIWTPSVVSSATSAPSVVTSAISAVRELDAPAANCDALIWCASSSASEAHLVASISRRSFFLARASFSAQPLCLLALSRGGGGGISVVNRSANTVSSEGSTEGVSESGTLTSSIVSMSARRLSTAA